MAARGKTHAISSQGEKENKDLKESEKRGKLREKVFVPRESMLTVMYNDNNIQSLYNLFLVVLIIQCLHTVVLGLIDGRLDIGQDFIMWNFGKLHLGAVIWLTMVGTTVGVYGCFRCWALRNHLFPPKSLFSRYWDYSWLSLLIVYQTSFFILPAVLVMRWSLPPATAITILCEQVRMVMKSHAFVRSNAPRVIAHKPGSETSTWPGPGFSHFLYFLFCPTLIYRDTYPRTKEIRWRVVAKHLLEVLAVVFYHCYILQRWIQPSFREWGLRPSTPRETVQLVFGSMLPAILADVSGIYCFLHAWSNAAAEILRFADRLFYQDWWNSTSYGVYFRKWNMVVHDWLYTYIYRDIYENLTTQGKFLPTMAVFITSALVHEYILAFAFGFFYPIMFVMFVVAGAGLVFVPTQSLKCSNTVFLLILVSGAGVFTSFYSMEIYARVNCVQTQMNWLDFVTPRSWNCIPVSMETPL